MNKPPEIEHAWFRRHLPDHLLDLLVEGDRERFERHARGCAPCARLLASALGARADWWDGAGHPPVGALLKWDAVARGDRTQELARAHVANCESCRRDLEDLLGVPVAREVALAPAPRGRRTAPSSWGLAAAAGMVLVAAVAVVCLRGLERPAAPASAPAPRAPLPAPAGTTGSMGAAPAPAPATAPVPGRTAEPVTIAATERGAESTATPVRIEPGVTRVPLTLPALFVPDGFALQVELRDHAGALISRQVLAADRALRPGGVLLPTEDLADGAYVLVVRWTDPSTGETSREFPLDVRISR